MKECTRLICWGSLAIILSLGIPGVERPAKDYVMSHCERYRTGKPMLEAGVNSHDEMLRVMRAMRQTTGPARTLWTSVIDMRRMTYEMRYFKEYGLKYEIDFSPRLWSSPTPPSSSSTVP